MKPLGQVSRMLLASGLVAALVAVCLGVVIVKDDQQQDALHRARVASGIATQANVLQDDLTDLASGTRAFVLTGDTDQLAVWTEARDKVEREADLLAALVAGQSPVVAAQAQAIARDVAAYRREYADPIVALARRDRAAAALPARQLDGITRARSIGGQVNALVADQDAAAEAAANEAEDAGNIAQALAIVALVLGALSAVGLAAYLTRVLVAPLRRLTGQLARMAEGDLSVRAEKDAGELRTLARAVNGMAERLQDSHRHAEHRREEKARVDVLYRFGARIATESVLARLADVTLEHLCALSDCEIGILYSADDSAGTLPVAAVRGLGEADRPEPLVPGRGLAGQALEAGRPARADHPAEPLRVRMLGGEVAVRHELHVPLVYAERVLGVVSLCRLREEPFDQEQIDSIAHMSAQAAVAFSNLKGVRATERHARVSETVFAALPVGIALTDVAGEILMTNPCMRSLLAALGLPTGGNLLALAEQLVPEVADSGHLAERLQALAADPALDDRQEFRLLGSGHTYEMTFASMPDGDGGLLGRVIVLSDVTAERESQRIRDEFVALVSHELRTPMTAVLGYIELALLDGQLSEATSELLEVATRNANRLTRLIGDLILVSQARGGQLTIEGGETDVAKLAREAVEAIRPLAAEQRVTLEVREPDESLLVTGDSMRLRQVVDNLVSNAVKFSPAGGGVQLSLSRLDGLVQLTVTDSGPGIQSADMSRLFEPFFRGSSTANAVGGTGLGLAVVRAIVEAHRGSVSVESSPDGATFLVRLPIAVPAAALVGSGPGSH